MRMIVCDIAGTTVADRDFVAASFLESFISEGIEVGYEEVKPLMGFRKSEAISMVLEARRIGFDEATVYRIHDAFEESMLRFYSDSPEIEALPDVEGFMAACRERDVIVALNTGFPRRIAEAVVGRMGWLESGLVTDLIASDEVSEGRPSPEMILTLMERHGIEDTSLVMKVGDTMVDIQEGQNARCGLVVGVTTGAYSRESLLQWSPDHVIDRFGELNALIWR